jgi:predicted 3-demethylubiquinone-9 3-methyltransferase (glyoxalase superfamily)
MTRFTQKIVPHLWFGHEARDAAEFYCSVFPDSMIEHVGQVRNTPSGHCDLVWFRLGDQPFQAISAGPMFRFNPSISFIVNFDPARDGRACDQLDATWATLAEGGEVLMPVDRYPFSARYGWVQDRYGVSWQLILTDPEGDPRPFIIPALLFTGERCGQAADAGAFWRSVFQDSAPGRIVHYPPGIASNREGTVMFSDFRLGDTWFAAMDSGVEHGFDFNEAVSFMVFCRDQAEIDRYWSSLSAVPEAEACGWCKDRFGVSWQLVPAELDAMMRRGEQARIDRLTQAFLPMKKLDLGELQKAYKAN